MFALALIPPVFDAFMKKHLDNWDKNFATEAEIEIVVKVVAKASKPKEMEALVWLASKRS